MTASASVPIIFDPANYTDIYGFEELLIDGGVMCNNPAYYSYLHAKFFLKQTDFRVLSLGTGIAPGKQEFNDESE